MSQASAVVQAADNDGPSQQAIALSPADALFASQHTRAVVKAMKPRIASNLALITSTPVNTVPPVIAGTGAVGQTLRVTSVGSWVGGGSLRYRWQRDAADIAGATTNSYLLVAADSTHSIRAVVTSTNQYGPTSANSNAIACA